MKYVINPELQLHPFHGSDNQRRYLCETPRINGTIRRDLVDSELAHLLFLFDGNRDIDAVLHEHKVLYPESRYTQNGLHKFVKTFCIPNSILVDPSAVPNCAVTGPPTAPVERYLYARLKLLSHGIIYPVVHRLSWLYSRPAFISFITLAVLMHLWLYWRLLSASRFNLAQVRGQQFLALTAIMIVGAFCHELGHATALARHGCKRLQIGVGLYLYLPVLYTDVSEAWRLKPLERAAVDFGGAYFHFIAQAVLLVAFYGWHKMVFLYAIFMIDITIISCMNPFLRMDGYWLLTDLCGIWNLRKQSLDLGRYCFCRLTGRRPLPNIGNMSPRTRKILIVYSVVFGFFFIYLVATLAYQLIAHVVPGYPVLWLRMGHCLRHPTSLDAGEWLTRIFELLWNTFLIIGCCVFARNTLRRAVGWWSARGARELHTSGYEMTAVQD